MTATLPAENQAWGFRGTMGEDAAKAWPRAIAAISEATGAGPDAVRAFLDCRHGRHCADDVMGGVDSGASLNAAIAATTACWMGWQISRRTSRETGISVGLHYLSGFVIDAGVLAEAAA